MGAILAVNSMGKALVKEEKMEEGKKMKKFRTSCKYGIGCKITHKKHLAKFAHPANVDYQRPRNHPKAPDNALACIYGESCYRRNPEHFRKYKHPSSNYKPMVLPVPPSPTPTPTLPLVKRIRRKPLWLQDYV